MMKVFVVLGLFTVIGFGSCVNTCYDSVIGACARDGLEDQDLPNCDAKYGAIEDVENLLQKFVNTHIGQSFEYLLMSTHFGNYEKNRHGFEHLFRKLSDSTWNDAIELIKYNAKRGGTMDFNAVGTKQTTGQTYELHELGSLARALEAQKVIAKEAFDIHKEVSRNREHDPGVASYLENQFVAKHEDTIRELAGHTNDLKRMIKDNSQASLATFLFDEYLQKL